MLKSSLSLFCIILLIIFANIRAHPRDELFSQWVKSQVMIYSFDVGFPGSPNYEFTKKFSLRGKCFGNLITPKHVITAASCVLDKKILRKSQNKIQPFIEEMRVSQVTSFKNPRLVDLVESVYYVDWIQRKFKKSQWKSFCKQMESFRNSTYHKSLLQFIQIA